MPKSTIATCGPVLKPGETAVGQDYERRQPAPPVTRRALVGAALAATVALPRPQAAAAEADDGDALFAALDQKIMRGMARYAIPGAAVGVLWQGRSYLRGRRHGRQHPEPVNADTLFHTGSIGKTFTGTAAMRLVDQERLVLDEQVSSYVSDFVAPVGAASVTVRQLLDHSAGWLGDDFHDTVSMAARIRVYPARDI